MKLTKITILLILIIASTVITAFFGGFEYQYTGYNGANTTLLNKCFAANTQQHYCDIGVYGYPYGLLTSFGSPWTTQVQSYQLFGFVADVIYFLVIITIMMFLAIRGIKTKFLFALLIVAPLIIAIILTILKLPAIPWNSLNVGSVTFPYGIAIGVLNVLSWFDIAGSILFIISYITDKFRK